MALFLDKTFDMQAHLSVCPFRLWYFIPKTTSHILLFNYVSLNPQLLDQNNCRVEHIFGINDFILSELYAHDLYSQINDSNTVNQTSGYKMKMNNFLLPNERVLRYHFTYFSIIKQFCTKWLIHSISTYFWTFLS